MFSSKLIIEFSSSHLISSGSTSQIQAQLHLFKTNNNTKTSTLVMIALPSHFRYSELENFMNGNTKPIYLRYFRNSILNCTFVILHFDLQLDAISFYNNLNGKKFDETEGEVCHLFFVEKIIFLTKNVGFVDEKLIEYGVAEFIENDLVKEVYNLNIQEHNLKSAKNIDKLKNDKEIKILPNDNNSNNDNQVSENINSNSLNEQKIIKSGDNQIQLPSCPVCLQRLDHQTSGVLTIQCSHTFHCSCLFAWHDLTCPVCRSIYSNTSQKCYDCECYVKLWACLICGKIGCDRYTNGHALKHALEENHFFALEVGTDGVWDYINEIYVHRIVHDEDDKMVVIDNDGEKINEIRAECELLMINQMEKQQKFYEDKIKRVKRKYKKMKKELKKLNALLPDLVTKSKDYNNIKKQNMILENEIEIFRNNNKELLKENNKIKKKYDGIDTIAIKQNQELINKTKELNGNLKQSKKMNELLIKKVKTLKDEIEELKEERNELYFHIENYNNENIKKGDITLKFKKKK